MARQTIKIEAAMDIPNKLIYASEVNAFMKREKQRNCDRGFCSYNTPLFLKLAASVLRLGKCAGLLAVVLGVIANLNAQQYWRTDNSSATWTGANWSNPASSTGGSAWVGSSNVIFSDNSTVTFASATVGNVTVAAGKTVTVSQAGTLTNPSGSLVTTYDIGDNATLTWTSQGVSSNSGAGFIKNGNGTWNRGSGGGNNYTGGFTLNAGTVIVSSQRGFGTAALAINGGTINSSGSTTFSVTSVTIGGNFALTGTGNDIYTADVSLGSATRTITNNSTGNRIFSGIISGSSGAGLTFNGTGNTTLSGANTYNGTTTLNGGTLSLNSTNALQNSTLNTGAAGSQVVNFIVAGTNTYNLGGLAGADNLSLGANSISVGSNNSDTTYSAVISSTGGGLTKVGTGALTLSGANTYSGTTAVNSGTLALGSAGSIASSSVLKIASGATFDVKAKSGGFTLNNPMMIDVDAANAGKLDATGVALTYGGNLTLNITTATPLSSYNLFVFSSELGTFSSIALTGSYSGNMTNSSGVWTASSNGYDFTFTESNGVLSAATAAIPEPGTWVLVGIAAIFFLYRTRRKDASSSGHN
jgi:autotransporter-associated beta strand protein